MPGKPDRTEKGLRLGCGAVAGLMLGVVAAVQINPNGAVAFFVILAVSVLVAARGALVCGDEFWWKLLGDRDGEHE